MNVRMENENLRRDEALSRSALIATGTYRIELDVSAAEDPQRRTFGSRTTITFTCREPGASTFVDFIGEVTAVELNGTALDPAAVRDGARLRLDGLAAINTVTVSGEARYSTSGEGMHRFVDPADGETYLYTQYEITDLIEPLHERGVELSRQMIDRIVTKAPQRINADLLALHIEEVRPVKAANDRGAGIGKPQPIRANSTPG